MNTPDKNLLHSLREYSIPLVFGVIAALVFANVAPDTYHYLMGVGHGAAVWEFPGGLALFGHHLTLNYLINDIFMVFFFGIAAKQIVQACSPGGNLHPIKRVVNPLFATAGGVVGPIAVFFAALAVAHNTGAFPGETELNQLQSGWAIPSGTNIALAWVVARVVFGRRHAAIDFLLLFAVAGVAVTMFHGNVANPVQPQWLLMVAAAMVVAYGMRKARVSSWVPYVAIAGPMAWSGLVLANLHPALALVFVVPFLPGQNRDAGTHVGHGAHASHSPQHAFEHRFAGFVDYGLFFFALANAGVQFGQIGPMTWVVVAALVVGNPVGVSLFSYLGNKIGYPLPDRVGVRELFTVGFVAVSVALVAASAAYPASPVLVQAQMGALLSGGVGIVAIVLGRNLGVGRGSSSVASTVMSSVDTGASQDVEEVSGALPHADEVREREAA
ncbi:MAG: sodium:proton antiporter [Planctomycetes bacterium]|nr:sodium:proton antiporter [Planctomycetota bacterium]